jgi:hypothetical protein
MIIFNINIINSNIFPKCIGTLLMKATGPMHYSRNRGYGVYEDTYLLTAVYTYCAL